MRIKVDELERSTIGVTVNRDRLPHSTCATKSNIGHSGLSVRVKESELSVGQKYGLKKASNQSQLD